MKKNFLLAIALLVLFAGNSIAQTVPQGIHYQTIVRGTDDNPLANQNVTMLFTIKENGSPAYQERQAASTNGLGLVNFVVGQGVVQQGNFQNINWGSGAKSLSVAIETSPNIFEEIGTMPLMSVPYALYAANSNEASTAQNLADLGAQPNQILQWNGSAWVPGNAVGVGTVTQINTGPGLTGGPITNSGTIALGNTGVVAGTYGGSSKIPVLMVDAQGRLTNVMEIQADPAAVSLNEGTGIDVLVNGLNNFTIVNTGDTDATDDVLKTTPHDGDVSGIFSNLQIKAGAVGNGELANNAVTGDKIGDMGAGNGQVLKFNGTDWVPADDIEGGNGNNYTPGAGIQITGNAPNFTIANSGDLSASNEGSLSVQAGNANSSVIVSNTAGSSSITLNVGSGLSIAEVPASNSITLANTGDTDASDDVLKTTDHDGDVSGIYNNLQIKPNAVGTSELSNNAVTAAKLDNMGAGNGQVLKFNGAGWAPADDATGGGNNYAEGAGIDITGTAPNFTIVNTGDTDASDDVLKTTNHDGDVSGFYNNLQIKSDAVTAAEIAANAVNTSELANNAVTAAKLNQMGAGLNQVLQWDGVAWGPATVSGNGFQPCGQANPNNVGIGKCPGSQTRLDILNNTNNQDKIGVGVDISGGGVNRGMIVSVANGSTDNDGVIALAFNGANNNVGMKIVSGSDEIPQFITSQNFGLYMDLRSQQNESPRSPIMPSSDVGLYVTTENVLDDYAAYFDGDVGIPHEIEFIDPSNGNQWAMYIEKANEAGCTGLPQSNDDLLLTYNGNIRLLIRAADGAECIGSDRRLKENIAALEGVLPALAQLRPVAYNLIADPNKNQTFGFIAQEVEPLFPELIYRTKDSEGEDLLTLNYTGFSVLAVKAIQEQQQTIEAQQAEIDALKREMAEIKAMLRSNTTAQTGGK